MTYERKDLTIRYNKTSRQYEVVHKPTKAVVFSGSNDHAGYFAWNGRAAPAGWSKFK